MFSLQHLSLAMNQIALLPDGFSFVSSLVSLSLQRNLLRELPPSICDCTNLESLTVSQNLLKTLPAQLGKLEMLSALAVDNNQFFKSFPASMANCSALKVGLLSCFMLPLDPFLIFFDSS